MTPQAVMQVYVDLHDEALPGAVAAFHTPDAPAGVHLENLPHALGAGDVIEGRPRRRRHARQ